MIIGTATKIDDLGVCYGHDLYEAELRYLIDHEWVRKIDDLIWRRSKLGLRLSSEQIAALENRLAQIDADPRSVAAE